MEVLRHLRAHVGRELSDRGALGASLATVGADSRSLALRPVLPCSAPHHAPDSPRRSRLAAARPLRRLRRRRDTLHRTRRPIPPAVAARARHSGPTPARWTPRGPCAVPRARGPLAAQLRAAHAPTPPSCRTSAAATASGWPRCGGSAASPRSSTPTATHAAPAARGEPVARHESDSSSRCTSSRGTRCGR